MEKKTTRELVGEYIDLDIQNQTDDSPEIEEGIVAVQAQLRRKVDGIDHFMVDIDRKMHLIDAEIEAFQNEIQRLKVRKRATESLKKYFNETLIPMVVEEVGTDGVYETDTARYKLYETFGPVAITNEDSIPDDYKKVEMVEKIDKKKARSDLTKGVDIPGFYIEKVKRVRRS